MFFTNQIGLYLKMPASKRLIFIHLFPVHSVFQHHGETWPERGRPETETGGHYKSGRILQRVK